MSALLESLEGEPLVEPLVTTASTAVGAEVTVTMLTFVAAANTGQSIMQIETVVSDGSFAPEVSVPLAVLDQISGGSSGPVAITTGKLPMQFARDIEAVGAAKARMDLNVSDAEPAPALATQPFSITVYDSNGEPIRGIQLAQPMTLQLAEDANDSIVCAFFNQTSFRWSTSGLRRVRPNMGNASTAPSGAPVPLICETDHLSIFSGVIAIPAEDMAGYEELPFEESNVANGGVSPGTGGGDSVQNPGNGGGVDQVVDVVDQVLRCTRAAGIFSAEGMNAVGRGAWTSSSSATALFVSLALFGAAAFAAFARDISRNQTKWMGQLMSLSYPDNEQEEEDEEEEKEEKARSLCKYCILVLQGLQAGVDPESLELAILVRTVGSKQGGELTKGKSPLYAAAVKLADIINVSSGYARATNLFLEANWLARMLLLFPAVHRSLAAGHGSLVYSRASKVVVIFLKIFFAGALAALFFQSGASGNDSEAACIEGAGLGITLLLGLASALVSDLMIYGLVSLRRQNFKSAHGNVELQLKVKEWRVRNLLFWAISLLVLIVSVYVIMAFFATVTPTDTETWAAGALVVLLEEFFFGPLLLAGAYSLLVTHTLEDAAIGQSMRMAAGAVQAPFRAWDGPSAADFRVPIPHEASAQGGQLRALGAAPHEDLGVQSLTLGEDQQQHGGAEVALQSREMEEQRRLQEQLREQLETQKKQLEQQQQMQVELRQQLQRQQQEMEAERRQRHRSPPPERPPARFQQQAWQQDNRSQVQQAPTALPLPGAVHLNTPPLPQIVTRPTQQVSSVNLGLQRAVRHGAVVRSGRPGPPSWPPPALRDTGRFGAGAPPQPDVRRYSRQ